MPHQTPNPRATGLPATDAPATLARGTRGRAHRLARADIALALACGMALAPAASAAPGATLRLAHIPDDPAALCEEATHRASAEAGVPLAIMQAIALTETGRQSDGRARPWPWALNFGGPGAWFQDRDSALAALRAALAQGRRNIDVGCFQINHRWHAEAFASVEEMIDPLSNARHAAKFLRALHAETGSWMAAAGAYHSRTPAHATRYLAVFSRHLEAGADAAGAEVPVRATRAASAPPFADGGGAGAPSTAPSTAPAPRTPGSLFDGEAWNRGAGPLFGERGGISPAGG